MLKRLDQIAERPAPQRLRTRVLIVKGGDEDGKPIVEVRDYYADLIFFDSNRGAKAFEEADRPPAKWSTLSL